MDKQARNRLFIFLGIVFAIVLGIFVLINFFFPKHVWSENYANDYKEPYGGYLTEQLLKNFYPGKTYKVLDERWDSASVISDTNTRNSNYVFLGTDYYTDSITVHRLAQFVTRGNNAMIITSGIPDDILMELGLDSCHQTNSTTIDSVAQVTDDTIVATPDSNTVNADTVEPPVDGEDVQDDDNDHYVDYSTKTYVSTPSVNINFTHPELKTELGYTYHYIENRDTNEYAWQYVVPNQECATFKFTYAELGTLGNDHVNFIRVKYGKGSFLLHTTPLAFSNYYLLDKVHLDYAEKAFSHLTPGNIYWDQYSQTAHFNAESHTNSDDVSATETPLRYLLSQDSLRWAWYLVLTLIVLYSLFQLKRKQRLIPVLQKNNNTSIEFAQTVSRLYFQQNDHRSLVIQQMRLFLAFIRARYHINTTLPETELKLRIVAKSSVPEADVNLLFALFKHVQDMPDIDETVLIEFHQSLDNFYRQCK